MAELKIVWQNTTKTTVDTKEIEQHLLEVLRRLKTVGRVEIEISIVDDKEIKTLKQRFFGINEPTDVLSFPYDRQEFASHAGAEYLKRSKQTLTDSKGRAEGLTGSIAISVDTAIKQAGTAGIELIDELKTLSSHGLLHLLGYHHR
ncbi:MAG: rRNA maturation RNase YbeY [bacterium]|nr:rRNA maturation RNase YbeY [bacterium]